MTVYMILDRTIARLWNIVAILNEISCSVLFYWNIDCVMTKRSNWSNYVTLSTLILSTLILSTLILSTLILADARLAALTKERNKQLEEVFEMKQEAILAAISEKDANIALLEMSTTKKQSYQVRIVCCRYMKHR